MTRIRRFRPTASATGWAIFSSLCCCLVLTLGTPPPARAADHGDAPLISNDQGADIADVYAFLDPNDNGMLTLIMTGRGFITPGESENLGFFQDKLNWRFAIETTGDAGADFNVEVVFSLRSGQSQPQTATVSFSRGPVLLASFDAPTTPASATSATGAPFVVTTDAASGISFFAGMTDDPFFFDVPAELLFRDSLASGSPNPSVFQRATDTFAGFNVMAVAVNLPLTLLLAEDHTFLGVSGYTEPTQFTLRSRAGGVRHIGRFVNVDRMGIPGINTVLMPFQRKDAYNQGSTEQDADGLYAAGIISTLEDLGTSTANIATLADIGVNNGDFLRIDTTIPNTGPQGGTGGLAGFPNGRRLADDPIDVIVNIIANQVFDPSGIVDNVNANDKPFGNVFPFLAPPHQPAGLGAPVERNDN